MPKMTKAQARKRLKEARQKVYAVMSSGHISMKAATAPITSLAKLIKQLE